MKHKVSWKRHVSRAIAAVVRYVVGFASEAPRSIKGHLNLEELTRIAASSFIAGGGTLGFLDSIVRNIGMIFPAPADAALAVTLVTLLHEVVRRLKHGDVPATTGTRGGSLL